MGATGQANWKCGSANGNKSLHFSGSDYRYAQTQPMNVQHGAVIKFKVGPKSDGRQPWPIKAAATG